MPDLDRIYVGDCLEVMRHWPSGFVQTVVTSPPYWGLRDYGIDGQFGLEKTPEEYVGKMVEVFREVRRALRDDGTLWLNLGDTYAGSGRGQGRDQSYAGTKQATNRGSVGLDPQPVPIGLKAKDIVGIPWRTAFALQTDGWYLRSDIIWAKPNPMPESVTDRPTKAHEYLFLLAKSERYFYNGDAIKEPALFGIPSDPKVPSGWDTGPGSHNKLAGRYSHDDYSDGAGRNDGGRHVSGGFPQKDLPDGQSNIRKLRSRQRDHGRHHAGFDDRWDKMTRDEQCGGMRNKRSVWEVPTRPFSQAHFATFPPDLIKPCILAGSAGGGIVMDPFSGAGTTALVAAAYGRQFLGIELSPVYAAMSERRIANEKAQVKMAI